MRLFRRWRRSDDKIPASEHGDGRRRFSKPAIWQRLACFCIARTLVRQFLQSSRTNVT